MQVIETVSMWRKTLDAERSAGHTVGLIPTMGYLHDGHASLIRSAVASGDVAAVTIFVNPTQFGPSEDLSAYPRDLEADVALSSSCGARYVFAPSVEEMYPGHPRALATTVAVSGLSSILEGRSRPTHFAGVATVVTKLLSQAGPCRAYFGEKDYQQLAVIRRLVRDLDLPAEVVGCPTVREADGLALSSRNVYLSQEERRVAPTLHRALQCGAAALRRIASASNRSTAVVRQAMVDVVTAEPLLVLDYAEVVDAASLVSLPADSPIPPDVRLLIAAQLGRARLIDNLGVSL